MRNRWLAAALAGVALSCARGGPIGGSLYLDLRYAPPGEVPSSKAPPLASGCSLEWVAVRDSRLAKDALGRTGDTVIRANGVRKWVERMLGQSGRFEVLPEANDDSRTASFDIQRLAVMQRPMRHQAIVVLRLTREAGPAIVLRGEAVSEDWVLGRKRSRGAAFLVQLLNRALDEALAQLPASAPCATREPKGEMP